MNRRNQAKFSQVQLISDRVWNEGAKTSPIRSVGYRAQPFRDAIGPGPEKVNLNSQHEVSGRDSWVLAQVQE